MPDVQEVFRMATTKVRPDPGALERQHREQRWRSARRKAGVYALVAAFVVAGAVVAITTRGGSTAKVPAVPAGPPRGTGQGVTVQKVVVVGLDGTIQRQLHGLPADAYGLSPSPDGTKLAFVTTPEGFYPRIATIGMDGSGLRIFTNLPVEASMPAWSPDGSHIAFQGTNVKANTDLYVMDADGTHLRRITTSPAADVEPDWSPDGSTIVYFSGEGKFRSESLVDEIWTVPARGGRPTRLTNNHVDDMQPSWSADGTQIAWMHNGTIWVMDANGGHPRDLRTSAPSVAPRWSPDGTRIAFATYDPSWSATVSMDGSTATESVLTVHLVDPRTDQVFNVGGAQVATTMNLPRWLGGDALLLNRVQRP